MKYGHIFSSTTELFNFIGSEDYFQPFVSVTYNGGEIERVDYNQPLSNGYNFVDLGLPSGNLWADRNVGAASPEAYGTYFSWGEVSGKTNYADGTYKWGGGASNPYTSNSWTKYNSTDKKKLLDLEDDAANYNMGGDWCLPTCDDFKELTANTTYQWGILNGHSGATLTSKNNSNTIFIPACGYIYSTAASQTNAFYLSSSMLATSVYTHMINLYGASNRIEVHENNGLIGRTYGMPVRGVLHPLT